MCDLQNAYTKDILSFSVITQMCSHVEKEFSNTNIFIIHHFSRYLFIKYLLSTYDAPGHKLDVVGAIKKNKS